MRTRFFKITLTVLVSTATGSVMLYSELLEEEKVDLIDNQIRETAEALLETEFLETRHANDEVGDRFISEKLRESRVGKFFVVRGTDGSVIFKSLSAELAGVENLPLTPEWVSVIRDGRYIRMHNLRLAKYPDRVLQVGLSMDPKLVSFSFLSKRGILAFVTILLIGLVVAWFLSGTLLLPIRSLEQFIRDNVPDGHRSTDLAPVPESLKKLSRSEKDEYRSLLKGLDELIDKVNRGHKLSRLWAYQMAHELKTPLSLLEIKIENLMDAKRIDVAEADTLRFEMEKILETVNSFLGWAELENSSKKRKLFANKAAASIESLKTRLEEQYGSRVTMEVRSDFYVLAWPQHFEQILQNALVNALKYSPEGTPVRVTVDYPKITISDQGPGIPTSVMERWGEPFNRGNTTEDRTGGSGLGLAWIKTLSRIYGWRVEFQSGPNGTTAILYFETGSERSDSVAD